jgi:ribosomal protein S6
MEERLYDLIFIARPATPEDEVKKVLTTIEHACTEKGAKIEKTEHWGTRKLAYKVMKHREGIYAFAQARIARCTPSTPCYCPGPISVDSCGACCSASSSRAGSRSRELMPVSFFRRSDSRRRNFCELQDFVSQERGLIGKVGRYVRGTKASAGSRSSALRAER